MMKRVVDEDDDNTDDESESGVVVQESEFQDGDGRLWRVTHINEMHVVAKCIYPKQNNQMHGSSKSFDLTLAKQWIRQRLAG